MLPNSEASTVALLSHCPAVAHEAERTVRQTSCPKMRRRTLIGEMGFKGCVICQYIKNPSIAAITIAVRRKLVMTNNSRNALRHHRMNNAAAMGVSPRVHRYQSAGAIMLIWSRRVIILFFVVFSIRFSRGTACRPACVGIIAKGLPPQGFREKYRRRRRG
mgnify:CR=1 FL=1